MATDSQASAFKPHIILIAIVIVVLLAIVFWPSSEEPVTTEAPPVEPVIEPAPIPTPEPEPVEEAFEAAPKPVSVELDSEPVIESEPEPEPEIVAEPEPLDISDKAIETALIAIANSDTITDLLMNEGLLQNFVVTITNLADEEMAANHQLLMPPQQKFRTYQQAQREWIDPASYKRYTPYVNAMESLDNERLLTLFERYEEEIQQIYEQIGNPNTPFEEVFIEAIDTLLDTPEIKVPVEVYTDSVMFKYKDERLESLSAPQKQMLRSGPDNMRRIKAKLREMKVLLEKRSS